jgi:hypothetical protein
MSCIIRAGDFSSGFLIIPLLGPSNGLLEDKKTTFSVASLLNLEFSIVYTIIPGPREANLPQLYPGVECQKASGPDTSGIIVLGSWRVNCFIVSILYYI